MAKIFGDNPVSRFFGKLFDLLLLGVITTICCIPVITVGPALCANYDCMLKIVMEKDDKLFLTYFKSFKNNFGKGCVIGIIVMILIVAMVASYLGIYLGYLQIDDWMKTAMIIITTIISVLVAILYLYSFPLQARFENSISVTLKNALAIGVAKLPNTIGLIIINGMMVVASIYFYSLIPLFVIFEFSFATYFSSAIHRQIFASLGDKEAAGEYVSKE